MLRKSAKQERAQCQTNSNTLRAQSGPGRMSIACGNIPGPGLGDSGRLRRSSSVGGASAFLGAGALRDRVPKNKVNIQNHIFYRGGRDGDAHDVNGRDVDGRDVNERDVGGGTWTGDGKGNERKGMERKVKERERKARKGRKGNGRKGKKRKATKRKEQEIRTK